MNMLCFTLKANSSAGSLAGRGILAGRQTSRTSDDPGIQRGKLEAQTRRYKITMSIN